MLNSRGEPILVGSGGEVVKKAAELVDRYNETALALAEIVTEIYQLRHLMNDVGNSVIFEAGGGGGWVASALTDIPMLKMTGKDFPPVPPQRGVYLNKSTNKSGQFLKVSGSIEKHTKEFSRTGDEDEQLAESMVDYVSRGYR